MDFDLGMPTLDASAKHDEGGVCFQVAFKKPSHAGPIECSYGTGDAARFIGFRSSQGAVRT